MGDERHQTPGDGNLGQSATGPPVSENTVECSVCREPIKIGSKKCVHCDSFQDWRRNLGLSSSVLALLVALVSVVSIAAPMLKETFATRNSKVMLVFQGTTDDHVYLIASNRGTKPGGFGSATLIISGASPNAVERTMLVEGYNAGETFIAAGASKQIILFFSTDLHSLPLSGQVINFDRISALLKMRTIEFDGSTHEYPFTLDRNRDRRFILKSLGVPPNSGMNQ
jgi:hypothetical protein